MTTMTGLVNRSAEEFLKTMCVIMLPFCGHRAHSPVKGTPPLRPPLPHSQELGGRNHITQEALLFSARELTLYPEILREQLNQNSELMCLSECRPVLTQ